MPRVKPSLSIAHYALLGLLLLQPAHGYELLRRLRGETGAGRIVPLKPATLYATLHELNAQGLIAGFAVAATYPPRTFFEPTPSGRERFLDWLAEPVHRIREVRSDFLLKVYFAGKLSADAGLGLLEKQLTLLEEYAHNLAAEMSAYSQESFEHLVAESKLTAAESTLAWLRRHRERLTAARPRQREHA